jgi:hypothetical protein
MQQCESQWQSTQSENGAGEEAQQHESLVGPLFAGAEAWVPARSLTCADGEQCLHQVRGRQRLVKLTKVSLGAIKARA